MKIFEADALDTMRAMEPGTAQVMLTDPPYCSGGWSEEARAQSKAMTAAGERDGWFNFAAIARERIGTEPRRARAQTTLFSEELEQ